MAVIMAMMIDANSMTAVTGARRRFPRFTVEYLTADLLSPPHSQLLVIAGYATSTTTPAPCPGHSPGQRSSHFAGTG